MQDVAKGSPKWPLWQRVCFRFLFVLFLFIAAPWTWLSIVPGVDWVIDHYNNLIDWIVGLANTSILHIRPVLVPINGSGDTSFGWAALWTYCGIATIDALIWSMLDYKRTNYSVLNYVLCVVLRYFLCYNALAYGIAKLFLTQMPFPNTSELATPLGDYLPMRLSWMFIGYSAPYQFFSGVIECIVGLLLLFRRTATFGALLGVGVFMNVAMLNLSYDIPVKIFSLEMVAISVYLVANEWRRISNFLLLNRLAGVSTIYNFHWHGRWMLVGKLILKLTFIVLAIEVSTVQTKELSDYYTQTSYEAFRPSLYEVHQHNLNGSTLPLSDSKRWKDVALDGKRSGSVNTTDTAFDLLYGRRYFVYDVDTQQHLVELRRQSDDRLVASLQYLQADSKKIELSGLYNNDTIQVTLSRSRHNYQLAERQFHWLSEANR